MHAVAHAKIQSTHTHARTLNLQGRWSASFVKLSSLSEVILDFPRQLTPPKASVRHSERSTELFQKRINSYSTWWFPLAACSGLGAGQECEWAAGW